MKTNARASLTLCTRMNPRMHHTTSEKALREYRNHATRVRERSRGWGVPVAGNIHEVASPSEVHRVHAQTQQQQQRGPFLPTPLLSTHNCLVNFCIPYEPLHREPYRRLKPDNPSRHQALWGSYRAVIICPTVCISVPKGSSRLVKEAPNNPRTHPVG